MSEKRRIPINPAWSDVENMVNLINHKKMGLNPETYTFGTPTVIKNNELVNTYVEATKPGPNGEELALELSYQRVPPINRNDPQPITLNDNYTPNDIIDQLSNQGVPLNDVFYIFHPKETTWATGTEKKAQPKVFRNTEELRNYPNRIFNYYQQLTIQAYSTSLLYLGSNTIDIVDNTTVPVLGAYHDMVWDDGFQGINIQKTAKEHVFALLKHSGYIPNKYQPETFNGVASVTAKNGTGYNAELKLSFNVDDISVLETVYVERHLFSMFKTPEQNCASNPSKTTPHTNANTVELDPHCVQTGYASGIHDFVDKEIKPFMVLRKDGTHGVTFASTVTPAKLNKNIKRNNTVFRIRVENNHEIYQGGSYIINLVHSEMKNQIYGVEFERLSDTQFRIISLFGKFPSDVKQGYIHIRAIGTAGYDLRTTSPIAHDLVYGSSKLSNINQVIDLPTPDTNIYIRLSLTMREVNGQNQVSYYDYTIQSPTEVSVRNIEEALRYKKRIYHTDKVVIVKRT